MANEIILLERVRIDIGEVTEPISELLQYTFLKGFNDDYTPNPKARFVGNWTISGWYSTADLQTVESSFDSVTVLDSDPGEISTSGLSLIANPNLEYTELTGGNFIRILATTPPDSLPPDVDLSSYDVIFVGEGETLSDDTAIVTSYSSDSLWGTYSSKFSEYFNYLQNPDAVALAGSYGGAVTWLCKSENQDYIPIVEEDSDVLHNLIDTGHYRWLDSDGSAYILTDLHPNDTVDELSAVLKYTNDSSYGFCMINRAGIPNDFLYFMASITDGNASMGWRYSSQVAFSVSLGNIYTVSLNSITTRATVNGSAKTCGSGFQGEKTGFLTIFGSYNLDLNNNVKINPWNAFSVHETKVYRSNNLIRYFVPFKRNDSYGLLDVHDPSNPVFYSNSGTGDFTCTIE